jgi:hypothetical protein
MKKSTSAIFLGVAFVLASGLWFIAVVALVALVVIVGQLLQRFASTFRGDALLVDIMTVAAARYLWRDRESTSLFAATYFGLFLVALGPHPSVDVYAAVSLLLGAAASDLGVTLIHPEDAAMSLDQLGLLVGAPLMLRLVALSLVAGLGVGIVDTSTGVRLDRNTVSIIGVVTLFIFVRRILVHYVAGMVVALAAFRGENILIACVIGRDKDDSPENASTP